MQEADRILETLMPTLLTGQRTHWNLIPDCVMVLEVVHLTTLGRDPESHRIRQSKLPLVLLVELGDHLHPYPGHQ
jgi:hypothetical protein